MSLRNEIGAIPFEDHHVHAPERAHQLDADAFRRPFTEASIPAVWQGPLASQIGYRWMVRELAGLLGVAPDEAAIVRARNAIEQGVYHRRLADAANLGACYDDYLFGLDQCFGPDEWAAMTGRPVHRVLRIETFVERLHAECPALDDALERLTQEIQGAPGNGLVALKSIAGYRVGLEFQPPTAESRRRAVLAYAVLRARLERGEAVRIESKHLVDAIVWAAFEAAAPLGLPVQFHVAFGDDDIVMTRNDPSLMRVLLQHESFRTVPVILLHCYPYHRTAGYLASIYPNVYVDLGLTIPIAGHGSARILAEALELTPVDQLLASTDGHMTPEFQWFGVHVWRWALEKVIGDLVSDGIVSVNEGIGIAAKVLRDNARRVYPVD